jgi:hypothetical protein
MTRPPAPRRPAARVRDWLRRVNRRLEELYQTMTFL